MSIAPGSRIGPYEVTAPLGEGGMGVVYRGRDTNLQREVALKLLPDHLANDPDRLSRFQREAQLLASLNHPNIAHIYGLEQGGGSGCIVMELVEGETLAERLAKGPIPLDDAIEISKQLADALAAAHERGIVHRDLKPANIKLTPNGTVKVLDFGLAKAVGPRDSNLSALPTQVSGSMAGTVVGTVGYMSPEQARGKEVDARTDIWAFGCVLYEMLTAQQAFRGETATDIMASIVTSRPDPALLPKETPSSIRLLLDATLNKNAQQRLQHIGDVRLFLDPSLFPSATSAAAAVEPRRTLAKVAVAVLAVALVVALVPAILYFRTATPVGPEMRFEVSPPEGVIGMGISPDAQKFALATQLDERRMLAIRPIGGEAIQPLTGTEGVAWAIWSPDSRFIAFVAEGKVKKIDVSGGSPQTLADLPGATRGGDWNGKGDILIGRASDNLIVRVPDSGGEPTPALMLDAGRQETLHALPAFLADGNHFVYAVLSSVPDNSGIYVAALDGSSPPARLMGLRPEGLNGIAYADTGHLLTLSGGALTAQQLNPASRKLEGEPVTIDQGVDGGYFFSVSDTGLLMYRRLNASANSDRLRWFNREGRETGTLGAAANYGSVELSPNEDLVAVDVTTDGNRDIWVIDVARSVPSRLTSHAASDWTPSWSQDGSRILFASAGRNGSTTRIYTRPSSGVGADQLVFGDGVEAAVPVHWSPDGKYVVFSRPKPNGGNDTWLLDMSGDPAPSPYLETAFDKFGARISPNSRWIAYSTNESGVYQIVVQSFPDPNRGRWQITAEGGIEPKWRRDGRELYYLALDGKLMSVPIRGVDSIEAGRPAVLFQTPLVVNRTSPTRDRRYDVSADGQRFLIVAPDSAPASRPYTVLLNWHAAFDRL